MKVSQFKQLVREEVKAIVKEFDGKAHDASVSKETIFAEYDMLVNKFGDLLSDAFEFNQNIKGKVLPAEYNKVALALKKIRDGVYVLQDALPS